MLDPEISVIIVAHSTKDYLLEAAKSANDQSLHREMFEVICVKNFIDNEFDMELSKYVELIINSESQNYGEKVVAAVKASRGQLLCFLDYDDKFSREKLRIVHNLFNDIKRLVYLHNARSTQEVEFDTLSSKDFKRHETEHLLDLEQSTYKKIQKFFRNYPDFNSSSITVRKKILEGRMEYMKKLVMHPDTFLLFCALETDGVLIDNPSVMTFYRLHQSTTNLFSDSYVTYFEKYLDYHKATESDWNTLSEFLRKDTVKRLSKCESIHNHFLKSLFDFETGRRQLFSVNLQFIKCLRSRKLRNMLILSLIGFVLFLIPKTGRWIYYLFNTKLSGFS